MRYTILVAVILAACGSESAQDKAREDYIQACADAYVQTGISREEAESRCACAYDGAKEAGGDFEKLQEVYQRCGITQ